jgi:hypothetical protein
VPNRSIDLRVRHDERHVQPFGWRGFDSLIQRGPCTRKSTEEIMTERTIWETIKLEGSNLADRLEKLINEGNVRRVVVEHQGKTVAEFPLTAGIIGAVIAPVAAAIGGLVAILQDCTIKVERTTATPEEDVTSDLPTVP